jgi:predicted ATPase
VTRIFIEKWRNFENIELCPPRSSRVVCLVGENGTGKTNLLELLTVAAPIMGIAAGTNPRRPFRQEERHKFSVTIEIPHDLEITSSGDDPRLPLLEQWDRTLTWESISAWEGVAPSSTLSAGGLEGHESTQAAEVVRVFLQQRVAVNYAYLDADRSSNQMVLIDPQYLEAMRLDPEQPALLRQHATLLSDNLYVEWLKAFAAQARRAADSFYLDSVRASQQELAQPQVQDVFANYRQAVQSVLPHLRFLRMDQAERMIFFESAGREVSFRHLSGGEREIAFLIGQIERFQLRQGLLIVDEPELHLNSELLRTWLSYVRDSIEDGQVWIGTHALEAVEVAGQDATFVLERDNQGIVRNAAALADRPALATLAGAVGSPAFSLARTRFVLVEGERPGRERERFARLCPESAVRFVEVGNAHQVAVKVAVLRELAPETEQLRIGGVVDRDHRADDEVASLEARGVHVLEVHEVENFLLEPALLAHLMRTNARPVQSVIELVRAKADAVAGWWILHRAAYRSNIDPGRDAREFARQTAWGQIDVDTDAFVSEIVQRVGNEEHREHFQARLSASVDEYRLARIGNGLWKQCSGKELVRDLFADVGVRDEDAWLSQAALAWSGDVAAPQGLLSLRTYIRDLPLP